MFESVYEDAWLLNIGCCYLWSGTRTFCCKGAWLENSHMGCQNVSEWEEDRGSALGPSTTFISV